MLLRIEDMLTIKEDTIAVRLLLDGMFDSKLAELSALKDELEVLAKKVDTVRKAEGVKKAADDYAEKIRSDVDTYYAQAQKYEEDLKTREAKVAEDREALEAKDIDYVTKSNAFAEVVRKQSEAFANRKKEMDTKEDSLRHKENELATWEESLREQNKTLQSKLDLIKGL